MVGKVYRSIILVGSWLPLGARSFQTSHQNERSFRWETSKYSCPIILAGDATQRYNRPVPKNTLFIGFGTIKKNTAIIMLIENRFF